jgi:DNA-binding transcriptional LysR family regulator
MDLRQLRYFQAVAEELSFSKAARRLRIAQPALSRVVRDLEDELGAPLLERSRRRVQLTEAGAVLLHEAGVVLLRFDEAMRRVRRTIRGEEGEIRVGYIGAPTAAFLGRLVAEYRRQFPRVTVHLEERTPERVCEMIAAGRLSLGLTRPVLAHEALGLRTLLLRRERLCAVLPAVHPLAAKKRLRWADLAGHPLVILSRREGGSLHDEIMAACREACVEPQVAHTPSVVSTVLSYVEAGAGLGVIAESVSALGVGTPLVFHPLHPLHHVDLSLVWPAVGNTPPATAFRTLVTDWQRAGQLWSGSASLT